MTVKAWLLLLALTPCRAAAADLPGALAAFGVRASSAAACELTAEYRRGDCAGGKLCFSTVKAACGAAELRVELTRGLDEARARRYAAQRLAGVRQLYAGRMEYPGAITSAVEVPPELRPRERPAPPGGFPALFLPASAGKAYGAGAPDLVAHAAGLTHLYCPAARALAQVEFFAPPGTSDAALAALLDSLGCLSAPKEKK